LIIIKLTEVFAVFRFLSKKQVYETTVRCVHVFVSLYFNFRTALWILTEFGTDGVPLEANECNTFTFLTNGNSNIEKRKLVRWKPYSVTQNRCGSADRKGIKRLLNEIYTFVIYGGKQSN
jgi:hypothetical protein